MDLVDEEVKYQSKVRELIHNIVTEENAKQIYDIFSNNEFDEEGWAKYRTAKKMFNVNVTSYFYAEDNLGYFEEADGNKMLQWLEIAVFGDVEYKIEGCYEMVDSYNIDYESEKYLDYQAKLWVNTVQELIGDEKNRKLSHGPVALLPQIYLQLKSMDSMEQEPAQNLGMKMAY